LNRRISDKDKKDWENFLQNKERLSDKEEKFKTKKRINSRTFDFHGYSLDEANQKIEELIGEAYRDGVNKLIIVTGKGLHSENSKDPYKSIDLGILKNSLPEFVKNNNNLLKMINSMGEANIEDGGSGAFYIFLKKKL
tara:strand:- start:142 stop:555 length:414 start_codon:yes stop_codon:yes gene_type:complete